MTTTTTAAAMTASAAKTARNAGREPLRIAKRIGSGTFIINVFASPSVTETLEQKLLRILEGDPLVAQSTRHWPGGQVGVKSYA